MTTAEKYVTAAYCVVFAVVLVYVLLIAVKLGRLDREVAELERRVETRLAGFRPLAELLFWPALLFYGEAAVGYLGEARRPGRSGRLATWGVRLGWLAQTALLAVQAARNDGFPWGTWASSLDLFVWLVVSAYLIWGCRARVPAARPRRDAARGRAARDGSRRRRNGSRRGEPVLDALPRPPRRARPRRVRRVHARGRAVGAVRLAGAAAQELGR